MAVHSQQRYTPPADGRKVTLRKPVTAYGEQVREVIVREPVVGDLRGAGDLGKTDLVLRLIERCAGLPRSAVDALGFVDFAAISEALGFEDPDQSPVGPGVEDGETSRPS